MSGGTLFFGDPADVRTRRIISFDFKPDGVSVRAFPTTDSEIRREFKLTPRRVAAVRAAFRIVMRDPLDMPPPQSVPDPREMRTCNRVVASIDHGCLLMHLLHCARVNSEYCYTAAKGLFQIELDRGRVPVDGMREMLSRNIRNELARELGPERAAKFGLIRDGEDMSWPAR